MAHLDTRSKRASSVNLLKTYAASLVLPDGTFEQNDRQHSAWAYSGIAATANVPVVAEIVYGGDDAPRQKRRKRHDVFREMERTIHALLHPAMAEGHPMSRPPLIPIEDLTAKLHDLLALAGESHGLLQRTSRLRADLAAVQAQHQKTRDEDELILLILT